jgi:general secretion pathway protein G
MEKRKNGFTIVEILVVIILISLIATLIAPKMFKELGAQKAKIAKAKMATIEGAIGRFYLDCERFPDESVGLEELIVCPSGLEDKWKGAYLKKSDLLDPWNNSYIYVASGQVNPGNFDLISYGADGAEGGEGDNADIYND